MDARQEAPGECLRMSLWPRRVDIFCPEGPLTYAAATEDAITFSSCRNIELLGWHHPERNGLERIIDTGKLYPITILHGLDVDETAALAKCGLILVRDLLRFDLGDISGKTGISSHRLGELSGQARDLLG